MLKNTSYHLMRNSLHERHIFWMWQAIQYARRALDECEIPIGSVIVFEDRMIGWGWNQSIRRSDPSAHAEIVAIRHACSVLGNYRLPGATVYVTLEPCAMCRAALSEARISDLVFGACDTKKIRTCPKMSSVVESHNHCFPCTGGVLAHEARTLLLDFFRRRRIERKK